MLLVDFEVAGNLENIFLANLVEKLASIRHLQTPCRHPRVEVLEGVLEVLSRKFVSLPDLTAGSLVILVGAMITCPNGPPIWAALSPFHEGIRVPPARLSPLRDLTARSLPLSDVYFNW